MKFISKLSLLLLISPLALSVGCSKGESYSDLLRKEEKAVNWFLSGRRVEVSIPADSVLECGPDAPFYKLNDDGTVYLQVINPGVLTPESARPQEGDKVYFRYRRANIQSLWDTGEYSWTGNSDNLDTQIGNTSFIYGETRLASTTQYGLGIQDPLQFVGYNSEVNIVIKGMRGFTDEADYCIPFLYNVRYFKPEY